jgi:NAD(P)-dependent dehydrogenase (short-subunit alcohol dehydrogenase family)
VTGGSSGIGAAICHRLARDGYKVAILSRSLERSALVARTIGDEGSLPLAGDVADEPTCDEAVAAAVARFGRLDVMVNNAGTIVIESVIDHTLADFDRVLAVNLRGTFLGARAAAHQMIAQGQGGRIINASSAAGRRGGPMTAAYSASKAGVIALTQSLAVELAPHDITVNAYCPGNVTTTPMWDYIDQTMVKGGMAPGEAKEAFVAAQPISRSGTVEEVAAVVGFLASEQASFVTGSSYSVDGGLALA